MTKGRAGTKGVPRSEREEQILTAAVEEFGRHGYAGVSMVALGRRVGVTKPLLYQYFGSKDGLYSRCLERVGAPLVAAVEEAMRTPAARPATPLAVLRAVFGALEGSPGAWFLLYDQSLPAESGPYAEARGYRETIDRMAAGGTREVLQAGDDHDALDADLLKRMWNSLVDSAVVWWSRHPDHSAEQMGERCDRVLATTLEALTAGRREQGG